MKTKEEIINCLIDKFNLKSYLEIGVQYGKSFKNVKATYKVGIDPDMQFKTSHGKLLQITSDQYFNKYKIKYDIILIDGLHEAFQCLKDIINAAASIKKTGYIICHDMLPTSKEMQEIPRVSRQWTGDVWKAWAVIKKQNPELDMYIVDTDFGVGVIKIEKHKDLKTGDTSFFNYEMYESDKEKIMGEIITPEEFKYKNEE